jgi:hypothetical protein
MLWCRRARTTANVPAGFAERESGFCYRRTVGAKLFRQRCRSRLLGSVGLMLLQPLTLQVNLAAGSISVEADSRNEMVIDLEDRIHFALHLLYGSQT